MKRNLPLLKVEKTLVPIPPSKGGGGNKFQLPFKTMKVGESFLYPLSLNVKTMLSGYAKRCGIKVAMRQDGFNVRIWRVK